MYITTKDNIKELTGETGSNNDVIITSIALSMTTRFEEYMGRLVEIDARTEYFDVGDKQQLFLLQAFPVSACQVWNDLDRTWNTEIDSSNYTFLGSWGELIIDTYTPISGAKTLKVTYTGGMASTQAAFQTSFSDIEMAARIQAAFIFEKRQRIAISAETVGSGSIRMDQKIQLLPEVKEVLDKYRRADYAT